MTYRGIKTLAMVIPLCHHRKIYTQYTHQINFRAKLMLKDNRCTKENMMYLFGKILPRYARFYTKKQQRKVVIALERQHKQRHLLKSIVLSYFIQERVVMNIIKTQMKCVGHMSHRNSLLET